jgi:hypothetical protein
MTARFSSNLLILLIGVLLLAASLGFGDPVIGWLGFTGGCLVTVAVLWAFTVRGRGTAQRVLDAATVLVGAWLIIGSRAFPPATVKWLTFADGALLIALSVIGLVAHEILVELALGRRESATGRVAIPQEPTSTGVGR